MILITFPDFFELISYFLEKLSSKLIFLGSWFFESWATLSTAETEAAGGDKLFFFIKMTQIGKIHTAFCTFCNVACISMFDVFLNWVGTCSSSYSTWTWRGSHAAKRSLFCFLRPAVATMASEIDFHMTPLSSNGNDTRTSVITLTLVTPKRSPQNLGHRSSSSASLSVQCWLTRKAHSAHD